MSTDHKQLTTTATESVAALEALDVGQPFAEPLAAAERSVEEMHASVTAELFPRQPQPVGADLRADLELYVAAMPTIGFPVALASLHGECLDSYPSLATAIRGPLGRRKLEEAARQRAHPMTNTETTSQAQQRAIVEDVATFQREVAVQLAGDVEHEPAAGIIAETIPELRQRINAAREKHEAHAAEQVAALEAQEREADAVVDQENARAQREADEAAAELEKQARQAEREQRLLRSRRLADRIERMPELPGGGIKLDSGSPWNKESLVNTLRAGSVSGPRLDGIEAALEEGRAA